MIPLNPNLSGLKQSMIRSFTNLARQTPGCAMLTIGEPDFDTPEVIKAAAVAALDQGRTHYAPNQGIPELRQAIARYETDRGNPTEPDQVLVTIGASQALFNALLGILAPGDEVIVPTPAFPLYETIITIAGGKMVPLDLTQTGFQIDEAHLNAAITEKTKAILLNSPNNPTGVILNEDSLAAVKGAVLSHPMFLICDNVYNQLTYAPCPDLCLDPDLKDRLILCQSFSKPYAMTGWRVGYLTAPGYVLEKLLLLGAAIIAAVPTFVQEAAAAALQTDPAPMRETYRSRRDFVCRRLREMGLSFPEPEGAFYIFPDISRFGLSSEEFCRRMITEGRVAAVPGICFGSDRHIRISYCYSQEELATGLDRMEQFLKTL